MEYSITTNNYQAMITISFLIKTLKKNFSKFEEFRQEGKIKYHLKDILIDGFRLFFYMYPSLCEYRTDKRLLHQHKNHFNLFGCKCDIGVTQLKSVLDRLSSSYFNSCFNSLFRILQRGKHLKSFEFFENRYLCAIDGTTIFSSNKLCCEHCLTKNYSNKENHVNYQHQILQGYICHPYMSQILPLMAESIINEDGYSKQDCELNASKRWIKNLRRNHPKLDLIILGDGLYPCNPLVELLECYNLSFILMCKPSNHKDLFENLQGFKSIDEIDKMTFADKERIHHYEWFNDIELNGQKDAKKVNVFVYKLTDKFGNILYKASWVTDIIIDKYNITKLVKAGRARWKSENEGFNTLKNQGYHIKHNFGHGKKNLCFNFYLLNLLSFFLHQILSLKDKTYQKCCSKWHNKELIFNKARQYCDIIIFKSFKELFLTILNPDAYAMPP